GRHHRARERPVEREYDDLRRIDGVHVDRDQVGQVGGAGLVDDARQRGRLEPVADLTVLDGVVVDTGSDRVGDDAGRGMRAYHLAGGVEVRGHRRCLDIALVEQV